MSATLAVGMGDRLFGTAAAAPDPEHEMVELALVLPRWQVEALATTARGRGLTAGQAIRRLIRSYCAGQTAPDR
jgi:hypothetical protein